MDPSITLGRKTLRSDKGMDPTITLGRKMIQCDKGMDSTITLDRKTIQSDNVRAELQGKEENREADKKKEADVNDTSARANENRSIKKAEKNKPRCNKIQMEKKDPSNRCPVKNRKTNKERKKTTSTLLKHQ
ncbi:hypothetical protein CHS0354_013032 [Potamilus streckersoni]|uniref:Uncharacterized protein n=1 Tax=Potamilus streckersoni TaxID=2493646 RepID=A0AAE0S0G5_9BIVA|nr:hypothetical protein CHS0354_013032 [Potamilus streckersoni]